MNIALYVQHPRCSVQCGNGIIKALHPKYKFKIFSKHELESGFFNDVDLICIPGGVGDAVTFQHLMSNHKSSIRKYVRDGGRYLGICMGAYWAGPEYLDIFDATIDQYITRPNSCTRRPHPKAIDVEWLGNKDKMYFYDGCTIIGDNMDIVATYSNGDPMAAIQGKVGVIGCHPEAEAHWYNYPSWMRKHYSKEAEDRHNKLLLEFVDTLMEK